MNKHIKRVAFILLTTVVCFLTACTDVVQPVMAAIVGDSNEFNTDNNRAFISNEELGRIVSYDGYISKAEYMAHQNSETVGANYHPNFELCTDTNGNAIEYVSSADGIHSPGTTMYQIEINGRRAYCIQPGIHTSEYVDYAPNTHGAWNDLSSAQQKAVNVALCYGREGNYNAIAAGTTIKSSQAYIATQVIIWEIVRGVRNSTSPYSLKSGENGYIGLFCADGYNPNIREAYNRISGAMSTYESVPSFASVLPDNPPYVTLHATYNSLKKTWSYESVTLTDSNGVLGKNFKGFNGKSVDVGNAKVTISVSGNKMTLTPGNATLNGTKRFATVSSPKTGIPQSSDAALVPYSASGYQDIVTGGSISAPSAYFQVHVVVDETTKLYSDIKLRKVIGTQNEYDASVTDEIDGAVSTAENLQGWYFRVSVNENSTFYRQYGVRSFTLGPTDQNGFTESFAEYIMKHYDYSNVSTIVPSDYYFVEEVGKKTEYGVYAIPDFYKPLREKQEIHFIAGTNNTQIHYNISHYTNIFTIPMEVKKTTDDGSTVSNYYFKITNRDTAEEYIVRTTNTGTHEPVLEDNGLEYKAMDGHYYIILPEGRYTLTELGRLSGATYMIPDRFATPAPVDFEITPEAYKLAQANGYKAITVNVANKCEGYLSLTKSDADNGEPVQGAVYGVFSDEDCRELIYQMPATDAEGKSKSEIRFACNAQIYVKEIESPQGYALSDTVYPVIINPRNEAEIVYELPVTDKKSNNPVEIRKTDVTGTKELSGAVLEVRAYNGALISSWISNGSAHVINNVQPGTYTLTEKSPANGYVTAESIQFTVKGDGTTTKVVMKDAPTRIQIDKVDEKGNALIGVQLQVLDNSGKVVIPTWTTNGSPYEITGKLIVGAKYKLHEVSTLLEYNISRDVSFTVKDTPDVQTVKRKSLSGA